MVKGVLNKENSTLYHGQHSDENEKLTFKLRGVTYTVSKRYTYRGQNGEGFRVKDVDGFTLSPQHQTADCVLLCHRLLHCTQAGNHSLKYTTGVNILQNDRSQWMICSSLHVPSQTGEF